MTFRLFLFLLLIPAVTVHAANWGETRVIAYNSKLYFSTSVTGVETAPGEIIFRMYTKVVTPGLPIQPNQEIFEVRLQADDGSIIVAPRVEPFGTPTPDRWLDGPVTDFSAKNPEPGTWEFTGSIPDGTQPFVAGNTMGSFVLNAPGLPWLSTSGTTVTAGPPTEIYVFKQPSVEFAKIGDVIYYAYRLVNGGPILAHDVLLEDDNVDAPPVCAFTTDDLITTEGAPGSIVWCTAQRTVVEADLLSAAITNTATVTSDESDPAYAEASVRVGVHASGFEEPANLNQSLYDYGMENGSAISMAVGADGNPVMSYYDNGLSALRVAKCTNILCSAAYISTIDELGVDLGAKFSTIQIGQDGMPIIAYIDASAGYVKVAKCNDVACRWGDEEINVVDTSSDFEWVSMAISPDGFPILSYHDNSAQSLKVAKCNDVACAGSNEQISTINDPATSTGLNSTILIGSDALPIISYLESDGSPDGSVRVAKCNDAACSGEDELVTVLAPAQQVGGKPVGLIIGGDGLPMLSYFVSTTTSLYVSKCNDLACTGGDESTQFIASGKQTGIFSITNGSDTMPLVVYRQNTGLMIFKCNDHACAGDDEVSGGIMGSAIPAFNIAVITGSDGLPIVGYFGLEDEALNAVHCGTATCGNN